MVTHFWEWILEFRKLKLDFLFLTSQGAVKGIVRSLHTLLLCLILGMLSLMDSSYPGYQILDCKGYVNFYCSDGYLFRPSLAYWHWEGDRYPKTRSFFSGLEFAQWGIRVPHSLRMLPILLHFPLYYLHCRVFFAAGSHFLACLLASLLLC